MLKFSFKAEKILEKLSLWYEDRTYCLWRPWYWLVDLKFRAKEAYRRATRGYDGYSVWGHVSWALTTIPKQLRELAKISGCPNVFSDRMGFDTSTNEGWQKALDAYRAELNSVADEMESIARDEQEVMSRNEYDKIQERVEKVFARYAKLLLGLWD